MEWEGASVHRAQEQKYLERGSAALLSTSAMRQAMEPDDLRNLSQQDVLAAEVAHEPPLVDGEQGLSASSPETQLPAVMSA